MAEGRTITVVSTPSKLIDVVLAPDGSNFGEWEFLIKVNLGGMGKDGHLTEDCPTGSPESVSQWKSEDKAIFSRIINCVDKKIILSMKHCTTVKELWDLVHKWFSGTYNLRRLYQLSQSVYRPSRNGRDIRDYYYEFKNASDALCAAMPISNDVAEMKKQRDQLLVFSWISGLGKEYDVLQSQLLGDKELESLDQVFARVQNASGNISSGDVSERHVFLSQDSMVEEKALLSQGNGSDSRGGRFRGRGRGGRGGGRGGPRVCYNCGDPNHLRNQCPKPFCYACGDPGHLRNQCPKLVRPPRFANSVMKPEGHTIVVTDEELALFNQLKVSSPPPPTNHDSVSSRSATFVQTGNPVACVSSSSSRKWVIDSGASDHMSGNPSLFSTYVPFNCGTTVTLADGSSTTVSGKGNAIATPGLSLSSVLYLPKFPFNLLSISQITRTLNCCVLFFPGYCLFQDLLTKKIIGKGKETGGLYVLDQLVPRGVASVSLLGNTTPFQLHCRNENDITERLKRIIQANASLRQETSETSILTRSMASWVDLQMEVAQYINSDVRGLPPQMQASRPLSGFVQRLKGKQGRFRGNLSGKRVEYTGRTVISPDPNLKITEVGIPILVARILTYPERVSQHNIEKLRQLVRNGPNKYPGAKFIRQPDGTEISLMYSSRKRHADQLKFGYIVDRHLEDGDAVLFNRQPSLHRMSIMCHRARIMPWRTLRFNESVCNPYNADFDGDEMNMHVPQTEEARTEALLLMGVQNNLCTPKSGEILVASTQDFLTSSFLITRKDTFYDRASFSLMCSYMGDAMDSIDLPTPALIKPVELWTGKQLFNVLLRPHNKMRVYVNLTVREDTYHRKKDLETMCPNDGFVYFRNSELISGQLGKATLGNGNKDGLYSVLLRDYNAHGAAMCMNRLAKLSARWIGNHGFSIGIDDVQPGKELVEKKRMEIEKGYGMCETYIDSYNKGELELKPGCDAAQTLEAHITNELNDIREKTGQVCTGALPWRNSPLIMSQCGSKGSVINISQMIACVGQQSVGGRRAPNGFIDRSLPHFPRKSKLPAAKGFVASSFYEGLTATEFFFHTMGGREGLVDTAVKTADTGYMSRRLMKALEDLSVLYDKTVRNASSCIVQFVYGDDGMDPSQMEGKESHPLNFNRLFMKVKATCPPGEDKGLSPSEILQVVNKRLSEHDMTPSGGCSEAFSKSLKEFLQNESITSLERTRRNLKLDAEHNAADNCEALENIALNISGVTHKQLQVFLETCISRYHAKKVEAGTAIGAIGAQSIGEPGTQMTLKTFHFAGVASMNITLGVPRIKEIINAAKKVSTPIISAPLTFDDNPAVARIVKGCIEKTLLGQVAKSIKIVMGSRSASIEIVLDMETIQASFLRIDAYTVKESILQTPRMKLKEHNIMVLNPRKLEVIPQVDRSKILFELQHLKNKLPTIVVKGISTVERAVINNENGKYNLLVEGTGLQAVMGTAGVDGFNTTSNHIMEVNQVLGIEAARRSIIDEIQYTMSSHKMRIDLRHMMLLADLMTFKGEVLGITRFGVQKMKDSVLTLASFEKTADHLFNAAVSGRDDKIEGVSECIIMGIPMQMGTGMFKVRQSTIHDVELNYRPDAMMP